MKFLVYLLAFTFLFSYIICNDVIFSKCHQNTFKIKDVRIRLISYDKNFFNFYSIKEFKYNRTSTVHNVTVNLKVNVEDKIEVLVQAYKFLSNEYRYFPIRFQVNFNKALDANVLGAGTLKNCGNMTSFYFLKGITYHSCNFGFDETRFPPLIPNGRYKVEGTFLYLNQKIAVHHVFLEIYIPIPYPKK